MQSFSNFVRLFLAPSLMNLCNKMGIGWTNFFAVAMVTKKGDFFLNLIFCSIRYFNSMILMYKYPSNYEEPKLSKMAAVAMETKNSKF